MILLKIRTNDGYAIKILAELLQSNLQNACFEVDEKSVSLQVMDRGFGIALELFADNFCLYKFRSKTKMFLGINMIHLHKMLKSIKKRDSLEFFIDDACPTELNIKIIPKEKGRVTTSSIKIQTMQRVEVEFPMDYGKSIIVQSSEFQKMCKGLALISNQTTISSKGYIIKFSNDTGGIMKRSTEFGEKDDSDDEDSEEKDSEYEDVFETDQLTKIAKVASLNTTMNIYTKPGRPILFKTQIGTLGRLSLYLKSKTDQETESRPPESEYEE